MILQIAGRYRFSEMSQFKGMRVLELASVLAGPSVGQFFAELGAEVIKVENIHGGGDVTRSWKSAGEESDDRSAYFCSVNWGKRSIAIDLAAAKGREIVHALAQKSDIVVASYKPGDAERLGVDYKTLSSLNKELVYGQINGYGSENPRVGYDAVIQAESGFMSLNGLPGGPPLKMPVALIDVLAAHQLKEGILLALLEKTSTGRGKLVEVSLLQTAVSSLVNQASNWLVGNVLPAKQGSQHPNIAPYGETFTTADGKQLLLAVGTDNQFTRLCKLLGNEALAFDLRFSSNQGRVSNRDALCDELRNLFLMHEAANLVPALHRENIPAGLILNVKEALDAKEAGEILINSGSHRGLRTYVGHPIPAGSELSRPPRYGEHTRQILIETLDFSSESVDFLFANRLIA